MKRYFLLVLVFSYSLNTFGQNSGPIIDNKWTLESLNEIIDINSLSDEMLVPPTLQKQSMPGEVKAQFNQNLGSGLFLFDDTTDPSSSLLEIKVDNDIWKYLLSRGHYTIALKTLTNRIYSKFEDDFDFIFFVLNIPENNSVINSLGFYGMNIHVSNDIQGVGVDIADETALWGSSGKLKSVIYFPYYNAILNGPALHELSHNWAAFICPTYDQNNVNYNGHWGVSNGGGQLGGFKYVRKVQEKVDGVEGKTLYQASVSSDEKNADGSFKYGGFGVNANGGNSLPYSDIELYLMGLKSSQELRNESFTLEVYSGNSYDMEGAYPFSEGYFYSTMVTHYSIDDIIAKNGKRIPDVTSSQKQFKILTVAITPEEATDSFHPEIIQSVEWFTGAENDQTYPSIYNFRQATNNVGSLIANNISNSYKNNDDDIVERGGLDNLTWVLDADWELTISGAGMMTEGARSDYYPWYKYRDMIRALTIEEGVTSIGGYAFLSYALLNSINIPSSVVAIGKYAFSNCLKLYKIDVNTNNAYYSSENGVLFNKSKTRLIQYPNAVVQDYVIPSSVDTIDALSFSNCLLTSVVIPKNVTSIVMSDYAEESTPFYQCPNLTKIEVDPTNIFYSSEDGVLFNKDKTRLLQFPAGKSSNNYLIPSSVINLGSNCFSYSRKLISLIIPNSVINIEEDAFFYCDALASIIIPKSVAYIGSACFGYCNNLINIEVDDSNIYYASDNGVLLNRNRTKLIQCPPGKTGEYIVPSTVDSIGSLAFYSGRLSSLVIPGSVSYIDANALINGCSVLGTITVKRNIPPVVSSDIFPSTPTSSIYLFVPKGSSQKYANADGWKYFDIREMDNLVGNTKIADQWDIRVSYNDPVLTINTPFAEIINIYSFNGTLLYKIKKQIGQVTFPLGNISKNEVIVVQGSSGWTKKIVK